jgi:hypothetical protein
LGATSNGSPRLVSYSQDSDTVFAQVRRADSLEAIETEWLVSCEGAHSVVRKQAGISFRGKSSPLAFFMAEVRMEGSLSHSDNHVWLHPDGSLAALPLPVPSTWRLFVEVTRQTERLEQGITVEQIGDLMSARAPHIDATIVGEPLWLSDFRISCRMVDRMHDGRVFLAGDAAHIHSPTGGQGITTGVQDAANLAWKLARVTAGAPKALLDTYDEERLPHAEEVLRETDRTTTLLFAPNTPLRLLRDSIVLPILRHPAFQRRMFGKFSQLHVHYRSSSLSRDDRPWWRRRRIRAGDRAPDVLFADTEFGTRMTLFSLMRPLHPLVLFNGVSESQTLSSRLGLLNIEAYELIAALTTTQPAKRQLVDVHGDFGALYQLRSEFFCLIRPDGHVGLVQEPFDETRLIDYLASISAPSEVRRCFV